MLGDLVINTVEYNDYKNMKTLDDYLVSYVPMELPKNPNISFDTLEALKNADELIRETREKIVETKYEATFFDNNADG